MARIVAGLLLIAGVWVMARPASVVLDAHDEPEAFADAMGLPEAFEPLSERPPTQPIDPEIHRAGIGRVESVLYRRRAAGHGDAEAVASAVADLANGVLASDGMRGRRAGLELLAFAGRIGARTEAGYSRPSLVGLRSEWEQIRGQLFQPASFLRSAAPDLDDVQEPMPAPVDPDAAKILQDAARELERLIARGRREVEGLGEPRYDPDLPGRRARGQIEAWIHWGERWRGDLGAALEPTRALSPPPHPTREPLLFAALHALERTHDVLARVPDGAGMWPTPFRPAWNARFEAAWATLGDARTALSAPALNSAAAKLAD